MQMTLIFFVTMTLPWALQAPALVTAADGSAHRPARPTASSSMQAGATTAAGITRRSSAGSVLVKVAVALRTERRSTDRAGKSEHNEDNVGWLCSRHASQSTPRHRCDTTHCSRSSGSHCSTSPPSSHRPRTYTSRTLSKSITIDVIATPHVQHSVNNSEHCRVPNSMWTGDRAASRWVRVAVRGLQIRALHRRVVVHRDSDVHRPAAFVMVVVHEDVVDARLDGGIADDGRVAADTPRAVGIRAIVAAHMKSNADATRWDL